MRPEERTKSLNEQNILHICHHAALELSACIDKVKKNSEKSKKILTR